MAPDPFNHLVLTEVNPVALTVLILALFSTNGVFAQDGQIRSAIRDRIVHGYSAGQITVSGVPVRSLKVLPEFYERRDFQPAWTRKSQINELFGLIWASRDDGLNPEDYHPASLERIRQRLAQDSNPQLQADFDILLTDALIVYGYHSLFGKVDPETLFPEWNFKRSLEGKDPPAVVQRVIDSASLKDEVNGLKPSAAAYRRLQQALQRYRGIRDSGGWRQVAAGPMLKPDMQEERVAALRRRLEITGDIESDSSTEPTVFGSALEKGVKRFQVRHGLVVDGLVGPATLAALNVSAEDKIDKIRVNLERARWLLHNLERRTVIVNIADYRLYLGQIDRIEWTTRVVVGKTYHKTPLFKSYIKYIVVNPTWTVPPGISRNEMVPKMIQDPSYAELKNISIIDRSGKKINPHSVDWALYQGRVPPYTFRQEPGPENALGRIKFIFPNKHFVYMHDTPSKTLFDHPERAFSHGCIRVQNPMDFATRLLGDADNYSAHRLTQIVTSGKTTTIRLNEPLQVMLVYWTAQVQPDGQVRFRNDVYDRDGKILEILDKPFASSGREPI